MTARFGCSCQIYKHPDGIDGFKSNLRISSAGAVLRLIADQGIFAPAFIGAFFSALFLLEVSSASYAPYLYRLKLAKSGTS